jgi:hypothetical protein
LLAVSLIMTDHRSPIYTTRQGLALRTVRSGTNTLFLLQRPPVWSGVRGPQPLAVGPTPYALRTDPFPNRYCQAHTYSPLSNKVLTYRQTVRPNKARTSGKPVHTLWLGSSEARQSVIWSGYSRPALCGRTVPVRLDLCSVYRCTKPAHVRSCILVTSPRTFGAHSGPAYSLAVIASHVKTK